MVVYSLVRFGVVNVMCYGIFVWLSVLVVVLKNWYGWLNMMSGNGLFVVCMV